MNTIAGGGRNSNGQGVTNTVGRSGVRAGSAPLVGARGAAGLFAARIAGATAGKARRGGQSVFASSLAPSKGKAAAGAPISRGAVRDLWRGFGSEASPLPSGSRSSASASSSGLSGSAGLGAGILALGLLGAMATGLAIAAGRRRAAAEAQPDAGAKAGAEGR